MVFPYCTAAYIDSAYTVYIPIYWPIDYEMCSHKVEALRMV